MKVDVAVSAYHNPGWMGRGSLSGADWGLSYPSASILGKWPDQGVRPHKEGFPVCRNVFILEMVCR